jgi:hypothetical protein
MHWGKNNAILVAIVEKKASELHKKKALAAKASNFFKWIFVLCH